MGNSTIPLSLFLAQVDNLISADDDELSKLARYRMIKSAVERYSTDAPDTYYEDEVGDAGKYYKLTGTGAVLANWVEGFSRISSIEYPAATVASDEAPNYLEPEDWRDDYYFSAERYLYLPNHTPAATETMRIGFTIPYTWTASATTQAVTQTSHGFVVGDYVYEQNDKFHKSIDARIATHIITAKDTNTFTAALLQTNIPVGDFFALCNLAAGMCCQAISAKYSRTNDPTINADSVGHTTRAGEFSRRAKDFIGLYERHLGISGGENGAKITQAAGDFVDFDTAPGWPSNRGYIFHGDR
jgi:hypothetical protein